jgi:hypothetical protein
VEDEPTMDQSLKDCAGVDAAPDLEEADAVRGVGGGGVNHRFILM